MYEKKRDRIYFQSLFDKNRELPFLSKQEEEKYTIKFLNFFNRFVLDNVCLKHQYLFAQ